jgi:orotidine-5'-phosphate decarboxylase
MKPHQLSQSILDKKSMLCVGLDTDLTKIPTHLRNLPDPVFEFNKQIIDATLDFAVAYKPNLAFYEAMGLKGWESLAKTMEYLPKDVFSIADAKRGDIGNTATMYAKAFFGEMDFDAITVAPYMGEDSVKPFLEFDGKWVFLLALTSNPGAQDFQYREQNGEKLYQSVVSKALAWSRDMPGHLGFVTGATRAEQIGDIRSLAPDSFFLVPGVGAQGGDLDAVCQMGMSTSGGLLINSSRQIIYAGNDTNFASQARKQAQAVQESCARHLGF